MRGEEEIENETLVEAALRVLNTEDPFEKAKLGDSVASKWLLGQISHAYNPCLQLPVPDRPARLPNVKLVAPGMMPKLGKAGSLQSRQAIVHSLVHTESWAIDLSWDIIARFGQQEAMPTEFFTDFVKVAQDEGRHFTLLAKRLKELGSSYGDLPAHDGLWDSAIATSGDLLARLAIEHCVHEVHTILNASTSAIWQGKRLTRTCLFLELIVSNLQARGLDVLPMTISRFRNGGDNDTADLLETVVYPEEITHCAAGVKWFRFLCARSMNPALSPKSLQESLVAAEKNEEVITKFHSVVRRHFRGPLKPPFNEEARKAAGFGPQWYEPLAVKEVILDNQ